MLNIVGLMEIMERRTSSKDNWCLWTVLLVKELSELDKIRAGYIYSISLSQNIEDHLDPLKNLDVHGLDKMTTNQQKNVSRHHILSRKTDPADNCCLI